MTGKNAPDEPGKQNTGTPMMVQKNQPVMAHVAHVAHVKSAQSMPPPPPQLTPKKKKPPKPESLTDCGLGQCKSEEFKMLSDPDIDNTDNINEIELQQIQESADDLGIDG